MKKPIGGRRNCKPEMKTITAIVFYKNGQKKFLLENLIVNNDKEAFDKTEKHFKRAFPRIKHYRIQLKVVAIG